MTLSSQLKLIADSIRLVRCIPCVLLLFLTSLNPTACTAQSLRGRVIGISDGDTITVLHQRTPIKIRLYGIDAPELHQPFGQRAKQHLSELIFSKEVTVTEHGKDRYRRVLAEIRLADGTVINEQIVHDGFAWWYKRYSPNNILLKRAEASAKAARRGLWREPTAIPPWEWRRIRKKPGQKSSMPSSKIEKKFPKSGQ